MVYPIGTAGKRWGVKERNAWRLQTEVHRSFQKEVVSKLKPLKAQFDLVEYGKLTYGKVTFPQLAVKSRNWDTNKPSVIVTGGVHGYETSGVQGAILFLKTAALEYSQTFNVLVVPCVSPWGYERIQRWNANAKDPNRAFLPERCRCLSRGPTLLRWA